MKTPRSLLTAFLAVSVLTVTAFAADISGKWKWASANKSSGPSEVTAEFVVKDGKLTGTVTGRQGPAEIEAATVVGDMVSFTVTRAAATQTTVFKYSGRISGDAITGTIEKIPSGTAAPTKTDWKATRAK